MRDARAPPPPPPPFGAHLVPRSTIELTLLEVGGPDIGMQPELVAAMQAEAEAFVETVLTAGCRVATVRGSDELKPEHMAAYLSRKWHIHVPTKPDAGQCLLAQIYVTPEP